MLPISKLLVHQPPLTKKEASTTESLYKEQEKVKLEKIEVTNIQTPQPQRHHHRRL